MSGVVHRWRSQSHSAAAQHTGKSALLIDSRHMIPAAPQRSHLDQLPLLLLFDVGWWTELFIDGVVYRRSRSQSGRHSLTHLGEVAQIFAAVDKSSASLGFSRIRIISSIIQEPYSQKGQCLSGAPTGLVKNLGPSIIQACSQRRQEDG